MAGPRGRRKHVTSVVSRSKTWKKIPLRPGRRQSRMKTDLIRRGLIVAALALTLVAPAAPASAEECTEVDRTTVCLEDDGNVCFRDFQNYAVYWCLLPE